MRKLVQARLALPIVIVLGACGSPGGGVAPEEPSPIGAPANPAPAAPSPEAPPEVPSPVGAAGPKNTWQLRTEAAPTVVWEHGVAYDKTTHDVVQYGGHRGGYPQSSYTHRYDISLNAFTLSHAPRRPPRVCITEVTYADSLGKVVAMHGSSNHGSMPAGRPSVDYTQIVRGDPPGPWFYDGNEDRWEDARMLPPVFAKKPHAPVAYDQSSDALVYIAGDKLGLYNPRTNTMAFRTLPPALVDRKSYAIAADPVHRKVVVFGGTGPSGWVWADDRATAYADFVHADTWLYDVASNTWMQAAPAEHPPRGMPLDDHMKIPMVYHPPSGTLLMLQTPLDAPVYPRSSWPAPELWSFDVATLAWTRIETVNPPAFMGLLAYAEATDELLLFGGGKDGKLTAGGELRPSQSRMVHAMRVAVPGRTRPAPRPERAGLATTPGGAVTLTWKAEAGLAYDVYRASAHPFPGEYVKISTAPIAAGRFVDESAEPGKVYAYQVAATGALVRSQPVFNQLPVPRDLVAAVDSATKVRLRWRPSSDADLVGYEVYRARGANFKGAVRLTSRPVTTPAFEDTTVDLDDGTLREYWVVAVNRAGIESGASPMAYTAPDAPLALDVVQEAPDRLRVSWQWPDDVPVAGFNVYHVDHHENTHGWTLAETQAWWAEWQVVGGGPTDDLSVVYEIPAGDTKDHYFYVRAVDRLGVEGFLTDIASATDDSFIP
jgi:hypothetical protein